MQGTNIIALKLSQLRAHYKASAELVSSKSGISVNNLLCYEAGTLMPSSQELAVLARLYRVGMDFFVAPMQQTAYQPTQASVYQQTQASAYQPQKTQAMQQTSYSQPVMQPIQPTQSVYMQTQQAMAPPLQQTTVQQFGQDIKSTKAYQARTQRLRALRRAALIKLFTFISILILGGIGCVMYFLEFGKFSIPVSHYGEEMVIVTGLTGFGLLKHFLHVDFFVRLLSANLYAVIGIGGLLAFVQLLRLVSKSLVLRFIAKCLTFLFVCCFLMSAVCFFMMLDSHSFGFIVYVVGLFICVFPLFFSFMKELKV